MQKCRRICQSRGVFGRPAQVSQAQKMQDQISNPREVDESVLGDCCKWCEMNRSAIRIVFGLCPRVAGGKSCRFAR